MAKLFPIPKKMMNPRAVHLYDLVALAVMFAVALTVLPLGTTLDLSVGFNEKSQTVLEYERQELTDILQNAKFSSESIEKLFESTTIQNGGTVYQVNNDIYYWYKNGEAGYTYYAVNMQTGSESIPTSGEGDMPRGIIILNKGYLSTDEDGRIYFDTLNGSSGWTDVFVDPEQVDMEGLTGLLAQNATLNAEQVATIWNLTQRNILIGYCDRQVWFHTSRDGVSTIFRGTKDGVEEVHSVEGELRNVMVAFNELLFYIKDGDVHIHSLETGETLYFPNTTDWAHLGEVRQIAYVKRNDGTIRLYTLNAVTSTYTDFTGEGTENNGTTTMKGIDCQNYTEVFTTRGSQKFTLWFQDIGQLVWRHEEG